MLRIVELDYRNPSHATVLIDLLDDYARDPMGGAKPLSRRARENLAATLANRGDTLKSSGSVTRGSAFFPLAVLSGAQRGGIRHRVHAFADA